MGLYTTSCVPWSTLFVLGPVGLGRVGWSGVKASARSLRSAQGYTAFEHPTCPVSRWGCAPRTLGVPGCFCVPPPPTPHLRASPPPPILPLFMPSFFAEHSADRPRGGAGVCPCLRRGHVRGPSRFRRAPSTIRHCHSVLVHSDPRVQHDLRRRSCHVRSSPVWPSHAHCLRLCTVGRAFRFTGHEA